ncbi:cytochrome P450 4A11-like isoform X2 [Felis catus]|uniref:cytochrome P450 4A11-like isoform X2 n=1 Tax=Felis catus TaxID=9685 RepID=UPI001D19BE73|nr:cytochrome P450 4A11-like isoform X2 [Felis catus]
MDKWEDFIRQNSYVEIFEHVSLMTLDTIMKCAFSYQGSHQADRLTPEGRWNHQACQLAHQHSAGTQAGIQAASGPRDVAVSGNLRALSSAWEHCSGTDGVITLKKAQLQEEGELEKVRSKRHLDFLDILQFAKWRTGAACLTRTSVLKWTRSCLRAMTPQPVASPGSSMPWPHTLSINSSAGKRSRAFWEMSTLGPPRPDASRRHVHTTMCIKEAL